MIFLAALNASGGTDSPYFFTTLAGSPGLSGTANGTGSAARFSSPRGIAVDASGNVYVADSENNTIRKITPAGVVTTLAGSSATSGSDDGKGSAAQFFYPSGIAVDGSTNLYVADQWNHTIRKISRAGVVTTLAGVAGFNGSTDGSGSAGSFFFPASIAVDSLGNAYVADQSNHTIRKINAAGTVSTLAGSAGISGNVDGTGAAARFNDPQGIATTAFGVVYVTDHSTIRKITPSGVATTLAGSPNASGSDDGVGSAARFSDPTGIAVDASGNLYVADSNNNSIRMITPDGTVTTLAGSPDNLGSADGIGSDASFYAPEGIAVDSAGNLYVADTANNTIRKGTQILDDPSIVSHPQSAAVTVNYPATFSVTAAGNAPVKYQWYSTADGSIPSGAKIKAPGVSTNSTLTVTPKTGSSIGYYVIVTNQYGSACSEVANLTVYLPPVLSPIVATPKSLATLANGASVTFTENVTAGSEPFDYQWFHGTNLVGTESDLTLTSVHDADRGTYICLVNNPSGIVASNSVTIPGTLYNLTVNINGSGKIKGLKGLDGLTPANGAKLQSGNSYTLVATPNAFNIASNWVYGISGPSMMTVTGTNLTFTMKPNLVVTAVFVTNPVSAVAGTYNGLFQNPSGVTEETAGALTGLIVGNDGVCSGTLYLNGAKCPLKGQFGIDGHSICRLTNSATRHALTVEMQLDVAGRSGSVTGSVNDLTASWQSDLLGWEVNLKDTTTTNFTLAIPPGEGAPTQSPGGYGYAKLTGTKGAATVVGALGDGSPVSGSMGFSPNGKIPLYLDLYNHTGLLFGWVDTTTNVCDLAWIKKSGQWTNYPAGFTNTVSGMLSPFSKVLAGTNLFPTTPTVLEMSGGDLAATFDYNVRLTNLTTYSLAKSTGTLTNSLAVSFGGQTGLMTGSFGPGFGKTPRPLYGIVLQNASEACGFFVGTNRQTGSVRLKGN